MNMLDFLFYSVANKLTIPLVFDNIAELSVRACARLAGLESSDSTPSNQRIRQCLVALLTPYVVRKLGNSEPSSILKVLNSNTENPYLIWDNSTRAELTEYLEQQQKSKIRSVRSKK